MMRRPVHGVDISHHQGGNIGWAALKRSGVQFMYHKATEGLTLRDPNYELRRGQARAAGMAFGAYHFARPSGGDALDEARFFVGVAKPAPGDLAPCLDLETKEYVSGTALVKWADAFCDEVERLTGVVPVVYTPYTLSDALEKKAVFWVPRYNNANTPPTRRWDIWQFSNGVYGVPNQVDGLGHVDLNTFNTGVTLNDILIPKQPVLTSKGVNVDVAEKHLTAAERRSKEGTDRDRLLDRARRLLRKIKPIR